MRFFTKFTLCLTIMLFLLIIFIMNCDKNDKPTKGDTQSPVVNITYPPNNSTVSGIVNVTADASDNVGVTKVDFYIDGQSEYSDNNEPWLYEWNAGVLPDNSQHTIYTKAYDKAGNTGTSSVIVVTVQAGNNPPYTPSSPTPSNGATNQSVDVDLSWSGGDPDGDPVTYDVYFGTSSSPPLVAAGRTSTTYNPATLDYNTKYYWKIVATDNRGGQATGPVWSFTTSSKVQLIGNYNTPDCAMAVFITNNYAYVADDDGGLQIINISNPSNPTLTGNYDTLNSAWDVFVAGSYAYVADGGIHGYGLKIINVSNPSSPTSTGTYNTPGSAEEVLVSGSYAYLAHYSTEYGQSGFYVIDISNPANPALKGYCGPPFYAHGVFLSGKYAYVADMNGLIIIDISIPSIPIPVGYFDTPMAAMAVFVSGNYAFVAIQDAGLQIINIGDPSTPTLAGSYDTPGSAEDVFVSGNYAYVADADSGLQIINVSDPSAPYLAGSYDTPDYAWGVFIYGNYIYVADCESGIVILQFVP